MRPTFSSRTDWDVHPSALSMLLQEKRSSGESIIDLADSNPTLCGIPHTAPSISPEILHRSALYEPDPKGLPGARRAIAAWYNHRGCAVDPEHIVLTTSTSEAYSFLLRLLCDVGESIAVPKPSYPLLDYLSRINDVACRHYQLAYDGEWHFDFGSLREALAAGVKGVIVVHPNNPTGSYVKMGEARTIKKLLAGHASALIVDEVFHSFPFGHEDGRAGTFAETTEVLTFTVNGLSKLVALPQMKLAWIILSGPPDLVTSAVERLEIIADTYLSVSTPVQHAVHDILAHQQLYTSRVQDRVVKNYEALQRIIGGDSPLTVLRGEGGWCAMLRLPASRSDEAWAIHLLESQNVLTHPGYLFDCDINGCLVLSLLPEPEVFSEGVLRIRSAAST
jgi:aspartate/methionine/tyrosine aminotransferase